MNITRRLQQVMLAATALLAIAPSSLFAGQESSAAKVDRLLVQLRDPKGHQQAMDDLAGLEPAVVIPRLAQAIRIDPQMRSDEWLRGVAFSVLARVDVEKRGADSRYEVPEQVALIFDGLNDPDLGVRGICLGAIRRVGDRYVAEAVQRVVPVLDSGDPFLAAAAAQALQALGEPAKVALPQLRRLLADQGQEARERWERTAAANPGRDVEFLVRRVAAEVRVALAGVTVDLDLYPSLDERGRRAGIEALRGPLGLIAAKDQSLPLPITVEDLRAAMAFVRTSALDSKLPVEARRTALHIAGWIALSRRIPDAVAREAIETVRALRDDADDEPTNGVRTTARFYLERWSLLGR